MKIRGRLVGGVAVRCCAVLALLLGLLWAGGCASPQMGPTVKAFNDAMDQSLAVYDDYNQKVHDLKIEKIMMGDFYNMKYKVSLIATACENEPSSGSNQLAERVSGESGSQKPCILAQANNCPKKWKLCIKQSEPRTDEQGGASTMLEMSLPAVPPDPNNILVTQMKIYAKNLLAIATSDSAEKINKHGQEIGESMKTISKALSPKGSKGAGGVVDFAVAAVTAVGQWSVAYMQYDAFRQYIPAADPIIEKACTYLKNSTKKSHSQLVRMKFFLLNQKVKELNSSDNKLTAEKKQEKVLALQKELENLQKVALQKPSAQFAKLREKHKAMADAAQKSMEDFTLLEPDMQTLANQAAELAAAIKKLKE